MSKNYNHNEINRKKNAHSDSIQHNEINRKKQLHKGKYLHPQNKDTKINTQY